MQMSSYVYLYSLYWYNVISYIHTFCATPSKRDQFPSSVFDRHFPSFIEWRMFFFVMARSSCGIWKRGIEPCFHLKGKPFLEVCQGVLSHGLWISWFVYGRHPGSYLWHLLGCKIRLSNQLLGLQLLVQWFLSQEMSRDFFRWTLHWGNPPSGKLIPKSQTRTV